MLENFPYCPILHSRMAEIGALGQLPAATKDRIFPLIVGRPWPNAKHLSRTWEKIQIAFGDRKFAVDLDRTRQNVATGKPASAEFSRLFVEDDGFKSYYQAVSDVASAIPVLRIAQGNAPQFGHQADHIDRLDRGVVLRLERGIIQNPYKLLDQVLERFDDISIFVDLGWSSDLLGQEGWASGIIAHVSLDHPEIELVVRVRLETHGWAFLRTSRLPMATWIIAVETSMRRS